MVKIKSGNTEILISEIGAEIHSVKVDGTEYMWCGDPNVWGYHSPLLFPICGGLINDKYTVNGKEYNLIKHGFCREAEFSVEKIDDSRATFLYTANEKTLKVYPYNFELRVTYSLYNNKLDVIYDVTNKDNEIMYYSIGSHEAYACPEGYQQYDVIFPEKETLTALNVIGTQIDHVGVPILTDGNVLPLYDHYFAIDALVFEKFNSKSAILKNRINGRQVKVEFPDATYLLIWTKPQAPYVCIEPWCGAPDYVDCSGNITEKPGIMSILPNNNSITKHTITFG